MIFVSYMPAGNIVYNNHRVLEFGYGYFTIEVMAFREVIQFYWIIYVRHTRVRIVVQDMLLVLPTEVVVQ